MPLFDGIKNWGRRLVQSAAFRALKLAGYPMSGLGSIYGVSASSSGIEVNQWTALNYSVVWAAVTVLSSSIASLPLILYRKDPDGTRSEDEAHPLFSLLRWEPNPEMSAMTFVELMQAHVLTWGNAYAEIERANDGTPVALWPIPPHIITPARVNGQLVYKVRTTGAGGNSGGVTVMDADSIFHLKGLGYDGLAGYSVLTLARNSIGLGMAAERYGEAFFGNGSLPGGVLTCPTELTDEARRRVRADWERMHQGPVNGQRIAILEAGTDFKAISVPPEDAQFLGTRQFQIADMARWFSVPPHMLRDLSKATYANIDQQSAEFVAYSLRPWMVRWEHELRRKLLAPSEKLHWFAEFNFSALLRGDMQARFQAYNVARNGGWMSVNDIRDAENMDPVLDPMANAYLSPMNSTPFGSESTKIAEGASSEQETNAMSDVGILRRRLELIELESRGVNLADHVRRQMERELADLDSVEQRGGSDSSKPYGNVDYADPGYQSDGQKRYPLDTEAHIRAAWNYIHQEKNAGQYNGDQVAKIKAKIVAAWKAKIDKDGPPGA